MPQKKTNCKLFIGIASKINYQTGEFLSFTELTTDIEFIQVDPIFGFTSIGEGARFEAELYAPGTDVRNAEPDEY